jgi:hypothetical protein
VRGGLPANDHAREDVVDEGQVEEPLAGLQVGEIAHPELVRALGDEAPLDQVRGPRRGLVDDGEPAAPAAGLRAAETVAAHQSLDAAARHPDAVAIQRLPHAPRSIGAVVVLMNRADALEQDGVLERAP